MSMIHRAAPLRDARYSGREGVGARPLALKPKGATGSDSGHLSVKYLTHLCVEISLDHLPGIYATIKVTGRRVAHEYTLNAGSALRDHECEPAPGLARHLEVESEVLTGFVYAHIVNDIELRLDGPNDLRGFGMTAARAASGTLIAFQDDDIALVRRPGRSTNLDAGMHFQIVSDTSGLRKHGVGVGAVVDASGRRPQLQRCSRSARCVLENYTKPKAQRGPNDSCHEVGLIDVIA